MYFMKGILEILPVAKLVHLLKENGMFNHELVDLRIGVPQVFKVRFLFRVHFTLQVALHRLAGAHGPVRPATAAGSVVSYSESISER